MAQASATATLEQVLRLAKLLSPVDKVRLIERLAPDIERDVARGQPAPGVSLRGLWRGVDITDDDIAEVRREMWDNFPRDDI